MKGRASNFAAALIKQAIVPFGMEPRFAPYGIWETVARLPEKMVELFDIGALNLVCAAGLPGTQNLDPDACISRLDQWTQLVKHKTDESLPRFHRAPQRFFSSEPYFRVLVLITVLQKELGLRYNPDKIPRDVPLDAADTFIHGALFGDGGTCTSIPVVYVSVGRRLGYP